MRTEKMITSTVTNYNAFVLFVNDKTEEITKNYVTIPELIREEKRMDYVRKQYENSDTTPVKIISIEKVEKLYGCTEQEFLKIAHELPARNQ